jgi:hypothetical protein
MATAAERPATRDERVYHPLDRLRGIIRRYVVIEGLLATLIFLGVWFMLALVLDYVVFKTFTWDWVQDGSWWFRLIGLVAALVVLAGILVFRIVRRLTTEFSYSALALVLERRYPKVLGDRLITAVEMADVEQAARFGYSAEMVRQTISEARERVATVDVHAVFNWRRLKLMALLAVAIPLAILLTGFAAHAVSARALQPARAAWKLYHVSTIVGERDLLLWDTPWPRRALLELQGDAKDGLRVARDGAPPRVRVKSYQWVIADRSRPDGWRPLMWNEVNQTLVGAAAPEVPFRSLGYQNEASLRSTGLAAVLGAAGMEAAPDENPDLSTNPADWTVDAIYERAHAGARAASPGEEGAEPPQTARLKARMGTEAFQQLQNVFARLDALADDPSYGRTLRKLTRPEAVTFAYTGVRTAGSGTFKPEGNGEYAGEITGLKEDVRFVVKAEDYRTVPRPIALIPPPTLVKLAQVSFQPAYLHYAQPVGEGYSALRGLRQLMPEERLSLTGDKSIFEVPSGTEVVLTGTTEQPIANAWVIPKVGQVPGAKPGSAAPVSLRITDRSKEHGTRPLRWSEVTDALLGVRVPEIRLPRFLGAADSRTAAVDPAAVLADDVVNWIRNDPAARDQLRSASGDAAFQALARSVTAISPPAAAAIQAVAPGEALERVVAILDANYRDEAGKYVLPLGTTFVLEFAGDYRFVKRAQPYEFDLVYQNLDRVESTRPMLIHVRDDQPPVVELASDVIRRVGNVYYVTPKARIPFVNESYIKDDNGLSKLEYTYTLYPEDSEIARAMRTALVTRAIIPPVGTRFPAVVQGVYHAVIHGALDRGDSRTTGSFLHGGFLNLERALKHETKAHLERLLAEPLAGEKIKLVDRYELKWSTYADRTLRPNGTLESFKWRMEGDFFDLDALKLEAAAGDVQPRYRVDLNVQATDTNFDTGPKTASNVDPIRLLVVSSGDLLVEIGKEEEVLGAKLDEALAKLRLCRDNYAFVNSKHSIRLPDEIGAVTVKSKTVIQDVAKAKEIVLLVGRAFRKIEKETVVNNLDERTIAQYGKFANRIERVLGETPPIVSPDEDVEIQTGRSEATPFGALTPRATFPAVEKDLAAVQENLDRNTYANPGQATEADIKLNALEQEITRIRQILGEAQSKDKLIKEARAIIERQQRVRREIQELERALAGELTREEPSIGPVGEVALSKGEAKKVKHTINWRQYKKDDLAVKLTVSEAGAVVVPEKLKLTFEDHQFDFTYEIRATNKEGSFTVTLTPEVGEKVEVKVTVK